MNVTDASQRTTPRRARGPPGTADGAGPPERWPRLTADQIFAPIPPPPTIVEGLGFYRGATTLIAGGGYVGKTFICQDLLVSLAAGRPAWGLRAAATKLRCLHVDLEQGRDITCRRYQRLAAGQGVFLDELRGNLDVVTRALVSLDAKDALPAWTSEFAGTDLVIVDSLRGAAPDTDENDARSRRAIDVLNQVAQENNQSIVLLHHVRKSGGEQIDQEAIRGSSAIFDAVSAAYVLVSRNGTRRARQLKDRYRETGPDLEFLFEGDRDGPMVIRASETTLVTRERTSPGAPGDLEVRVLEIIVERGVVASVDDIRAAVRARKSDVSTALAALVEKGVVLKDRGYRLAGN